MQKLRKQIYESFFNPVLHFLPLIVFMLIEDYWGNRIAWFSSLSVSAILFVYIIAGYRKLLQWYLISTVIYLFTAGLSSFLPFGKIPTPLNDILLECILLIVFMVSLITRSHIENFINNRKSRLHSMANNLNEMFRMIWILSVVLFIYIHSQVIVFILSKNYLYLNGLIHSLYVGILLFIFIYEIIRVSVVRIGLMKEEWWPIVNDQGKMIGSIQSVTSLNDSTKYMHPVVRVMLIDENRILLQKRPDDDLIFPGCWDIAISNHIRVNETVEQCILRTTAEKYGIDEIKPLFLTNYTTENETEFHYAFLFLLCKSGEFGFNADNKILTKWWTIGQIEENLQSGIFSENFITEYELIKRSGLLDQRICECRCRLKETIFNNSAFYKPM